MRCLPYATLLLASLHLSASPQSSPATPARLPALVGAGQAIDGGSPPALQVDLDDRVPGAGDGEAKEGASPYYLGFIASNYYPPEDERVDPLLASSVRLEPLDGRPAPTSYGFVMFSRRITASRLATLEALGCRVLGRHPFYTVKVALPPERIDEVAALDFVRWIGAPRAAQKVHPSLLQRAAGVPASDSVDMYVSVYESDRSERSTRVPIARPELAGPGEAPSAGADEGVIYRWMSNGWQQGALEALGCEVASYDDSQRTFRVRAPRAAIERLAASDFVLFVEEVPVSRTMHDDSTPTIRADLTRAYYNGDTSYPVPVGELDTGIASHNDLAHMNAVGWNLSGGGGTPWDDPCGHGTHVTGTIAGDGSALASRAGVAPGVGNDATWARLFNARVLATCAPQFVDLSGALSAMRSPYGTSARPMVVNNSWGTSPGAVAWTGSEYDARLLDDETFWQNQMYVFAAGNDGSMGGSIGLQAAAKNVFSVGSVDMWENNGEYAELSSFSSRGPTGDARWKPNVVAPGGSIRSLWQLSPSGYIAKSGTSMAAPHVTGVVAQMCDAHAMFRYAPARIAASLIATAVTKDNASIASHNDPHLVNYGAGRVEAYHAMFASNGASWTNWGVDLQAGQGTWADVYVAPGCARLVIAMNWHEQSASAGASQAAINDWDLYIDREPFTAGTNTGEYHGGLSSRNNVELRTIENPPAGWYRWKAHPYNATTTGRFGVSAFAMYGTTTPNLTLGVTTSATVAQPGEWVDFDVSAYSPSGRSSAVLIDANPIGGLIGTSWRYLADGRYDELLDNTGSYYYCRIGDLIDGETRNVVFRAQWFTDGWQELRLTGFADNVGYRVTSGWVLIDGTGPTAVPTLDSSTHVAGSWSCQNLIDVQWGAAFDAGIGVAGYSYAFDTSPGTDPDAVIETGFQSEVFYAADSLDPYYVHVRAIDWMGNAGPTVHAGPFGVLSAGSQAYCTAKMNSQFCLPAMSATGRLSATVEDDLQLQASGVLNNKSGLLFWGTAPMATPFLGGTRCVAPPLVRSSVLSSGGTPTGSDCSGVFDFAFTRAYAASYGLATPGTMIYTQYWYRDPQDPFATGLTDATAVLVCE